MDLTDLTNVFVEGEVLYGFCNGYFGRDSYGEKRVEAIGADWMIVREGGRPLAMTTVPGNIADLAKKWRERS